MGRRLPYRGLVGKKGEASRVVGVTVTATASARFSSCSCKGPRHHGGLDWREFHRSRPRRPEILQGTAAYRPRSDSHRPLTVIACCLGRSIFSEHRLCAPNSKSRRRSAGTGIQHSPLTRVDNGEFSDLCWTSGRNWIEAVSAIFPICRVT
jgi:hypothetical protein